MDRRTLFFDCETLGTATDAITDMAQRARTEADREPERFAALSPFLAEICCIGVRVISGAGREDDAQVLGRQPTGTEESLLRWFNRVADTCTKLVTFNGRGFDVPLIVHRMIRHNVRPCPILLRAAKESRYRPEAHFDLMEIATNGGATKRPSLREVCLGLGMADPKAELDGSDVGRLYANRAFDTIKAYCLSDVAPLEEIHNRYQIAGLIP